MAEINTIEKYSQATVVSCWQNLSRQGLQKCEQEMVRRYLPPHSHVLDAGCGAGRAVIALNQQGYSMGGVDLSLPMLLAGRALSAQAQLGGANLLALPFADGSFAAALMFFGALQHIPGQARRRQALAELARVVPLHGRLIVGLDNLAPGLRCYAYWLTAKLQRPARVYEPGRSHLPNPPNQPSQADATLWSRETRRVNPLVWHGRGLARSLRWRTWPGLVGRWRQLQPNGLEPGDTQVAQFSLQTTPGKIFYHVYQAEEFIADAASSGWRLLGQHSGTELNEDRIYPVAVRQADKQLFFAFEKSLSP
jgi:SAM-dependent methyltransferase